MFRFSLTPPTSVHLHRHLKLHGDIGDRLKMPTLEAENKVVIAFWILFPSIVVIGALLFCICPKKIGKLIRSTKRKTRRLFRRYRRRCLRFCRRHYDRLRARLQHLRGVPPQEAVELQRLPVRLERLSVQDSANNSEGTGPSGCMIESATVIVLSAHMRTAATSTRCPRCTGRSSADYDSETSGLDSRLPADHIGAARNPGRYTGSSCWRRQHSV